jgi:hypothetical protein
MSEKEKEIVKKLSDTIAKLDDNKKNYILGVADGMAIARESERDEPKNGE